MFNTRLLIGGQLVEGAEKLDVINPATGGVLVTLGRASPAQLEDAVRAAQDAQPAWWSLGYAGRAAKLVELADAMHAEAEQLARALTAEQGKPLAEAAGEVAMSEAVVRHFATAELKSQSLQNGGGFEVEAHYRPLGVVAGITPWNFPLASGIGKIAPALIVGNSFIWKPAPTTPLTALMFARLAAQILPPGVLNVIVDNNDLGAQISSHPGIAKVAFTGSTETGRKVMRSAADFIKRVTLELGGNDAAIVLEDADVADVAPKIFGGAFLNAGQICIAIKRVYAHASIYDQLCEALARLAREAVVGEGSEQGVQIGPVQNLAQYEKAKSFLAAAQADGTVIAGGEVAARDGYFVAPTIVRDIPDESRLVQEEQFAPILPILSFEQVEDAVRRANATPYGLGGSVWTKDVERGRTIAQQIDAGTVWVNQHMVTLPNIPFGGAKQSGLGCELGEEGLAEFAQLYVINIAQPVDAGPV